MDLEGRCSVGQVSSDESYTAEFLLAEGCEKGDCGVGGGVGGRRGWTCPVEMRSQCNGCAEVPSEFPASDYLPVVGQLELSWTSGVSKPIL